jgi:hypothetical protein
MAKKNVTLAMLAAHLQKGFAFIDAKLDKLDERMERGFAAVADDIADVRRELTDTKLELKGDIVRVQEQVTSIEGQLRNGRYESRLTKLESEVFGASGR